MFKCDFQPFAGIVKVTHCLVVEAVDLSGFIQQRGEGFADSLQPFHAGAVFFKRRHTGIPFQYSSGNSSVVALPSHSVMIQIFHSGWVGWV